MFSYKKLKIKEYANSISIKFIVFTAGVTLISVLTIGLFSLLYIIIYKQQYNISNNINEEITRYNTQRLNYIKETVDNRIFKKTLNILSELLIKNEFNEALHSCLQYNLSSKII
ncbi:MAG: hypothetical protein HPY74_12305 [Firmicutes bacterium]|nr:hypothetical protein [Bacillota bacterium]